PPQPPPLPPEPRNNPLSPGLFLFGPTERNCQLRYQARQETVARYVSPTTARAPPNIHDFVQSSPFHALYPAPVNGQTTSWSIPYAFSEPPSARRRHRRKQKHYKKKRKFKIAPRAGTKQAASEGVSFLPALLMVPHFIGRIHATGGLVVAWTWDPVVPPTMKGGPQGTTFCTMSKTLSLPCE
ncbi:unnamed protein product, partial [Ectocarpus sp. 8 AP-2014]